MRLILRSLAPHHIMLEWGSGGSTLRFSPKVRRYYSIEHDPRWHRQVRWRMSRLRPSRAKLTLVPPDRALAGRPNYARSAVERYAQFRGYIEQVDRLGVGKFHRVLIDGRSRPECALRVLPYLDHDSLVFIHDFFNTKYRRAEYDKLYACYELVGAERSGLSLAVLRPKHSPYNRGQ